MQPVPAQIRTEGTCSLCFRALRALAWNTWKLSRVSFALSHAVAASFLPDILQQRQRRLRRHFGVDLAVNGHDGCQTAGAQAGHGLQGKQAVRGGLPLSGQTQSVAQAS